MIELGVESAICVWDYDHLPEPIKDFIKQEAAAGNNSKRTVRDEQDSKTEG